MQWAMGNGQWAMGNISNFQSNKVSELAFGI
jgi:hypothetical protein